MNEEKNYFDTIAEGYEQLDTGLTPVRHFSEVYSLLNIIGPLDSETISELACSDGFFSRLLKKSGAGSLMAVDISPKMIEVANAHEIREPLGITYSVASIMDIGVSGRFDLVFSPFVMSYAKDRHELLEMCRILHGNLKPGGRLVTMNDNPGLMPNSETGFAKYGKTKRITPPIEDGAKLTVTWIVRNEQGKEEYLAFDCKYYTKDALEWAFSEAGFVDIRMHHPMVSPEGLEKYGEAYWALFLENPLLVFFECRKK